MLSCKGTIAFGGKKVVEVTGLRPAFN